jgi:RNase P/RNase MRP subunit p30
MTNMLNIIKATKGKNLIISSRTGSVYRHRTPYDIASLLISLGMNKN